MPPLPYFLSDFPGIGGVIKQRPEDFFVQEIPLYDPSGEGEHVYCEIEKIGLTTFDARNRLARALNVSPHQIGYAGLKDANALTRQTFSIQGTTEPAVMNAVVPGVRILWAARHGNKLRRGHLAGNRFAIKIRDVNPTDVVRLKPAFQTLADRGMPNYFGEQRFGRRGDNAKLGAALIRNDDLEVLRLLLGSPNRQLDDSDTIKARTFFEEGRYEEAMKRMPRYHGMERRVLARFIKTGRAANGVKVVDEEIRSLWVNAFQSQLFNEILAKRIQSIDRVFKGDFAWKHDSHACFLVEDAEVEQPRAERFEISPTGPLVGYRVSLPQDEPLVIEEECFVAHNIKPADFRVSGRHRVKGARRPLRVKPRDAELAAGVDDHGPHITVAFTLPAGCFATTLLREIMKTDIPDSTTTTEAVDDDSDSS